MDTLRFAVIGAGTWGKYHARAFNEHPASSLAAVCDMDGSRAKSIAESQNAERWYTDYKEIAADPSIAAVGIATPDFAHTTPALAMIEAGKHVLIEKPLATTTEECEQLIAAARTNGVKLMVDFHNRWNPPFAIAKNSIDTGELGTPMHLSIRLNNTLSGPTKSLAWSGRSTVAWFLASHCLDLVLWLFGEKPNRVFCMRRSRILKAQGVDTPDYYQTSLEFPSGATALVENSWILPDIMPVGIDFKCELVCEKGASFMDGSHHRMIERLTAERISYPDTIIMPTVHGKIGGFAMESIRHFVDCVVDDCEPMVGGEDGLAVTRVIQAMDKSADSGAIVEIEW